VEDFFFFLLAVVCWSLRLYFAALADCTAARGDEVWNGRRKGAEAIVRGAERNRVVGDALVRHEGQYLEAAMVDVYGMCFRPLPAIRYGLRCRSRTEVKRYWPLGARAYGFGYSLSTTMLGFLYYQHYTIDESSRLISRLLF
jgi:hypothetical protein